jgi:hypothetical protein
MRLLSASLLLILATAILAGPTPAAAEEPLRRVRLASEDATSLAQLLEEEGFDVLRGTVTSGALELIVSVEELAELAAEGYALELLEVGRPFVEIQAEQGRLDPESIPVGYSNVEGIISQMTAAAAAYPAICQFVDLTEAYDMPATYEGRHLYAVKISDNVQQEEDEPAFMMVGCHHAREIVTPVLALTAMQKFLTQYGTDPTITQLVNSYEIWIAPLWNPDGYNHVYYVDNMWRKNRRPVTGGIGIDLNRNHIFGWDNACSGSTSPSSDTYKGPYPASESETQTMMTWSEDQRFAKILDYHSSGREVLHGYDCWSHPFDAYWQNEAIGLSQAAGYGGSHRGPSGDGEHYEWQVAMMSVYAFLMETHTDFQPSFASAQQEAELIWPGTLWLLQRPIPLWGHVTDAATGLPLEAQITLVGVAFGHGEAIHSGGSHGRYEVYMPAGTYTVRVEADGYDAVTMTGVVVTSGSSNHLEVALTNPAAVPVTALAGPRLVLAAQAPFHAPGTLRWALPAAGPASLRLYDVRGALVRTLIEGDLSAGSHQMVWDGTDEGGRPVPAGSYFSRLTAGEGTATRRLLLLR